MIWHSFKLRPHNFFDRSPAIDRRNEPTDESPNLMIWGSCNLMSL